jgi:hypothetical protein
MDQLLQIALAGQADPVIHEVARRARLMFEIAGKVGRKRAV